MVFGRKDGVVFLGVPQTSSVFSNLASTESRSTLIMTKVLFTIIRHFSCCCLY